MNQFLGYAGISTVSWTWLKQDGMSKIDAQTFWWSRPIPWLTQRTPLMLVRNPSLCTCMHTWWYTKMEFKNCKRLKRDKVDGVRAGGEGNVTACLVFPLLEEQIPGIETVSYEGFVFRAELFLIDDIICGQLSLLQHIYSPTSWTLTRYSQSVSAPVNEIDVGKKDIGCIRRNVHRNEDDDNTLVECKTEAILPPHASKGDEKQITVANVVPG